MADHVSGDRQPRTIVVGLGNPLLGDDGVGWRVADEVEGRCCARPGTRAARSPTWRSSGWVSAACA